ncbi:hypothetical protein BDP27DRAFT_422961 [Rhodocollybia butyracea]|uniref:Uncharacterized protein n=1 Tax=Rhodocollybia butyracea TaxID=206335 RepID=A0A9P5PBP8_9AGAR|nr:hypothetical protein BDP27DRAFT_422961 [Rhodocollybia butyracea]
MCCLWYIRLHLHLLVRGLVVVVPRKSQLVKRSFTEMVPHLYLHFLRPHQRQIPQYFSTFYFSVLTFDDGSSTSPIIIRLCLNLPVLHIHAAPSLPAPPYSPHPPLPPSNSLPSSNSNSTSPRSLNPRKLHSHTLYLPTLPPTISTLIHLTNKHHQHQTLATQRLHRYVRTLEALKAHEQTRECAQKMVFDWVRRISGGSLILMSGILKTNRVHFGVGVLVLVFLRLCCGKSRRKALGMCS